MSVADFNDATMAETLTYITARQNAKEHEDRNTAEWFRWLAAHVRNANPYLKKAIQPRELLTFPDEKQPKSTTKVLTPEQEKALFDRMQKAAIAYQDKQKKK